MSAKHALRIPADPSAPVTLVTVTTYRESETK